MTTTSGTSGETQLEAGANQVIQVVKNGVIITIDVVNPGSSPLAIKDCMVGGIEVRQSLLPEEGSFCVAKEITPFSSIEEVLDALGPVVELNTSTYFTSLNYGTSSKHCTLFRFDHNDARYNTITVKNYPEAPRKAVSELSDDLDDLSFLLDGTLYQLPFDFGKLTENGWTIATVPVNLDFKEKDGDAVAPDEAADAPAVSKSVPKGWTEDFEAAKQQAAKEGKLILMDFSGSDWCGWCRKMDEEVFTKDRFVREASKKFVLVSVDSPRDKSILSALARKQNRELAVKYEVRGYPTVVIVDPDGKEVKRHSGYRSGGPNGYMKYLRELTHGVKWPKKAN